MKVASFGERKACPVMYEHVTKVKTGSNRSGDINGFFSLYSCLNTRRKRGFYSQRERERLFGRDGKLLTDSQPENQLRHSSQ